MESASIAIVGLGPRGLNILERIAALLGERSSNIPMTIHLIDPAIPGQGVHAWSQPQHLLVNTVAGQITMFSDDTVEDSGPAVAGPSLLDWVHERGYRCVDGKFIISSAGTEIGENDYLPRSLLGEYLTAVCDRLLKSLPANVTVRNHRREVVNISEYGDGSLAIHLQGDYVVDADFCFLALGHCESLPDDFDLTLEAQARRGQSNNSQLRYFRNPYPINSLSAISSHDRVALCGTGLTATDVLSALTVGIGGAFEKVGQDRMRYLACGREPAITIFSRQGLPFGGRAVNQKGVGGQYKARYFTREFIDAARHALCLREGSLQLDFDRDLWPTLKHEMAYVYQCTASGAWAEARGFVPDAASVAAIDALIAPLAGITFADYAAYQRYIHDYLRDDIADSLQGNVQNPRKAAADVIRDLRDNIRYAVDHCGLTPASHQRFLSHWCSIMNRIAVGPPKERNMELLALMEAGIVQFGLGQNPQIGFDAGSSRFTLASTAFAINETDSFDVFVRAKIDVFEPEKSTSRLVHNMLASGLAVPFQNGGFKPSGLAVDKSANLLRSDGQAMRNIWALGNIVEGSNFYTFVLPRPQVNSRAIQDAGKVVIAMLERIDARAAAQEALQASQQAASAARQAETA
ncbi:FAD/NAD(P)-binding protein [Oxalobacteraceae bacterium]|nr:FAD/NAD(P)-binding protein [Oxalobacteraceae bacterium]